MNSLRRPALAFLALLVVSNAPAPAATLAELCAQFTGYDQNGDGAIELARLAPLATRGEQGARVLLLVEPRLLAPLADARELRPLLERWADGLAREGYRASVIEVELAASALHQDGRYVLALREFLRAVRNDSELAGVVLVGHFPDALIVRTCNWRRRDDMVLHKGTEAEASYPNARYVRRVPEDVARRADIVLGDLDGRWEDVYVQPATRLPSTIAVFGESIPAHGGPCLDVTTGRVEFADFFHVADGKLEIGEAVAADGKTSPSVMLFDDSGDHECGDADRPCGNILARPDILVSRLDARGVALRPRRDIVGSDGRTLLDEQGQPQTVTFASEDQVPHWRDAIWEADPVLERRLLAEYLDRNNAYRTGAATIAWRPSSIACDLGSGMSCVGAAADDWQPADAELADVAGRPTVTAFANWMKYPAILRTVRAHSDEWGSIFRRGSVAQLDEQLATPWSWTRSGATLVPSLKAASGRGKLDWFLLRTIWERGAQATEPAFYLHGGCHAISPGSAMDQPYTAPDYGLRQGAEALLLYGNGLALLGRAKVFYDEPQGFADVLRRGRPFGETWAAYFELESQATSWGDVGGDIGRKRSYFWSLLGDWTLTLNMGHPQPQANDR